MVFPLPRRLEQTMRMLSVLISGKYGKKYNRELLGRKEYAPFGFTNFVRFKDSFNDYRVDKRGIYQAAKQQM